MTRHHRSCPRCGGSLKRVVRTADDKARADGDGLRRYACQSGSCGWEGLMHRHHGTHRRRSHAKREVTRWLMLAALLVLGVLAGLATLAIQALVVD